MYPGGCDAASAGSLAAFLTTAGEVAPLHVLYEIAVLDPVRGSNSPTDESCLAIGRTKARKLWQPRLQDGNASSHSTARSVADGLLPLDGAQGRVVAACPKLAPAADVAATLQEDTLRIRVRVQVLCARADGGPSDVHNIMPFRGLH